MTPKFFLENLILSFFPAGRYCASKIDIVQMTFHSPRKKKKEKMNEKRKSSFFVFLENKKKKKSLWKIKNSPVWIFTFKFERKNGTLSFSDFKES